MEDYLLVKVQFKKKNIPIIGKNVYLSTHTFSIHLIIIRRLGFFLLRSLLEAHTDGFGPRCVNDRVYGLAMTVIFKVCPRSVYAKSYGVQDFSASLQVYLQVPVAGTPWDPVCNIFFIPAPVM